MELDDELCLCFHVTKRKVINFLKREKPQRVSQLSECFSAGTGCGWCRPFLRRLWEQAKANELPPSPNANSTEIASSEAVIPPPNEVLPDQKSYAELRAGYLKNRKEKGTPTNEDETN